MKRLGGLWPQIMSFENLLLAYRKARKGKRRSSAVAEFAFDLESSLLGLQQELRAGTYNPGEYRLFTIYERKPRLIAAAPFRDRVVHHAVLNLIEPPIDRRFIHDSYACRKKKGVHAAVGRYQAWAQHYPYVLKMDIEQYFPSIDHDILKEKLRRYIKDKSLLALLDRIIDSAPPALGRRSIAYFLGDDLLTPLARRSGLPIGNLTSQFFANLYLDGLDHYIKQQLGARAYVRYVDDLAVLGRDKQWLHEVKAAVAERMSLERLRLHPRKAHVYHTAHGIDFLGYQLFPFHRRLRSDNGHGFRRRLLKMATGYHAGLLQWDDINPRVQSWIGHAVHADTQGLRRAIFGDILFTRG